MRALPLLPMKATSGPLPRPGEEGWAFEVKWDGHRVFAVISDGTTTLFSSNGHEISNRFADLRDMARDVHAHDAIIDGEVVAFDELGRPSFSRLQQGARPVTFMAFDIVRRDGRDLTALGYRERRSILIETLTPGPHWVIPEAQFGDGAALLAATQKLGLEGVIAKRVDSVYEPGRRSLNWRKVKNVNLQEFVIGGWTPGERARSTTFGAIIVGYYDGPHLRFAGKVGSGFDGADLASLQAQFNQIEIKECPFEPPPPRIVARRAHWVRPELVAQVHFTEWTADGILRHPVFKGLRDDKDPRDVTREP